MWAVRATVAGEGAKYDVTDARANMGRASNEWSKIDSELRKMAPARGTQGYDKYINEIHGIEGKTGQDRVKAAQAFIREHGKVQLPSDQPVVYLKAKGALAKLVEQVGSDGKSVHRQQANAGGPSSAEQALLTAPIDVRQAALSDRLKSEGITGGG